MTVPRRPRRRAATTSGSGHCSKDEAHSTLFTRRFQPRSAASLCIGECDDRVRRPRARGVRAGVTRARARRRLSSDRNRQTHQSGHSCVHRTDASAIASPPRGSVRWVLRAARRHSLTELALRMFGPRLRTVTAAPLRAPFLGRAQTRAGFSTSTNQRAYCLTASDLESFRRDGFLVVSFRRDRCYNLSQVLNGVVSWTYAVVLRYVRSGTFFPARRWPWCARPSRQMRASRPNRSS